MSVNSTQSNRPTLAQMRNFASRPLKLSNNFSATAIGQGIAGNISATRSNYSLLNNSIFTPARGPGNTMAGGGSARVSRYLTNAQLSSMANFRPRAARGQVPFMPVYTSAASAQNVQVKGPDTWTTIGTLLGTILPTVPGIISAFSKSDVSAVKPQGAKGNDGAPTVSADVQSQIDKIAVSVPPSATSDVSSYISAMTDAKDAPTLQSAITSAQTQLTSISNETSVYATAAAEEKTECDKLEGQTQGLERTKAQAEKASQQADALVEDQAQKRDSALKTLKEADADFGKAVEDYTKAHDAHIEAEQAADGAEANFKRADDALEKAQDNSKAAQSSFNEAKAAYEKCPKTRINPKTQQSEPNEPQLSEARAKMNIAQEKLREAKLAEQKASEAKNEAQEKLNVAKENVKSTKAKESEASKAKEKAAEKVKGGKAEAAKLEEKLTKEQKTLDQLKGQAEATREKLFEATDLYNQHIAKMDSMQAAAKLLRNNTQNKDALTRGIADAQARLASLPEKAPNADDATGADDPSKKVATGNDGNPTVSPTSDEPIDGGTLSEVKVTGKLKDLSTASNTYLQNALKGAIDLGEKDQEQRIRAEISKREGYMHAQRHSSQDPNILGLNNLPNNNDPLAGMQKFMDGGLT